MSVRTICIPNADELSERSHADEKYDVCVYVKRFDYIRVYA